MLWRRIAIGILLTTTWITLAACPVDTPAGPDGGASDGGAGDGSTVTPPLRDVKFDSLALGDYSGGMVGAITLEVSAFNGSQIVQVQDLLGEGQDLVLSCGTVTVRAPENHHSAAFVFNDDNAPVQVSIFDQSGTIFGRALDTRADASLLGVTRFDPAYKTFSAAPQDGSRLIGKIVISSCQGMLHELVLR